jgi:dTMP kinase
MFITLEGIEGSGKTSQIPHIVSFFEQKGKLCFVTREPGDTSLGKQLRNILLDPENKTIVPMTELLLFEADRYQHVKEKIEPYLKDNFVVICDRYYDSTTVYQGYAKGVNMGLINNIHTQILEVPKPDITLLFDLDPEIALQRVHNDINNGVRERSETRFDNESLVFHRTIQSGYLKLATWCQNRIKIIDASDCKQYVSDQITKILEDSIEFNGDSMRIKNSFHYSTEAN